MNPGPSSSNSLQQHHPLKVENEFTSYLAQESNQNAMEADDIPWGDLIEEQEVLYQDSKNINANATYSHPSNIQSNSRPYLLSETSSEWTKEHFNNELPYIPHTASAPYVSTTEPASQFGACSNSQSNRQNAGNIMFSENRDVQMGSAGDVSPMQLSSKLPHKAQMYLEFLTNDSQQSFNGYQEPQHDSSYYDSMMASYASSPSDSSDDDEEAWMQMGFSYCSRLNKLREKRIRNSSLVEKRKGDRELTESQSKRRKFE